MTSRDLLASVSPEELIRARCTAFGEGDFGFIYDSYHADSYFRRQFPDREGYLQHGGVLGHDYAIEQCRILRQREEGERARIIFYLASRFRGQLVESVELALLLHTDAGWRYHSSQKMDLEEAGRPLDAIEFSDFDRRDEKVFF